MGERVDRPILLGIELEFLAVPAPHLDPHLAIAGEEEAVHVK